ncbi:GNAT family protein [Ichthyenterobacterium sp. W332]|uniref:GNAT family protein n=1 Tax=Microcosmobacter mediterraneus TaxID=3075607 RepID=A0ABU2YKG3_9FLAO|nr:GNAT family protein [Ichthyenterobacterium sp. W332]MDT0558648.1 GNAT family protein [Ichthyenterobacterium sp. W332]
MNFQQYSISLLDSSQGEQLFSLIANNRSRLEDFFAGTVSKTETLEATIAYSKVIEMRIAEKSYFPFMIIDTNTNQFAGLVDVKNIDWSIPKAELGAFIDTHYESKGIVTEATRLVIDYIVEQYGFKKLLCRAAPVNKGSIRVILKNGFELEGTIRRDYKTTKGEVVDLNYYGRIFD